MSDSSLRQLVSGTVIVRKNRILIKIFFLLICIFIIWECYAIFTQPFTRRIRAYGELRVANTISTLIVAPDNGVLITDIPKIGSKIKQNEKLIRFRGDSLLPQNQVIEKKESSNENSKKYFSINDQQHQFDVFSPTDGSIIAIFGTKGDYFLRGAPMLEIASNTVATNGKNTVRLYVEASTLSYIESGSQMNVELQAFPAYEFGQFKAVVDTITYDKTLNKGDRPFFIVNATLEPINLKIFRKPVTLRTGMAVKADIIVSRLTLVEWLFESIVVNR